MRQVIAEKSVGYRRQGGTSRPVIATLEKVIVAEGCRPFWSVTLTIEGLVLEAWSFGTRRKAVASYLAQ